MTAEDRAVRQAFRKFVRAHHPDRGGDPDVFLAGLAQFRAVADRSPTVGTHRVSRGRQPTIYKRRSFACQIWAEVLVTLRDVVVPRSSRVR
jgi:hypothetical protein